MTSMPPAAAPGKHRSDRSAVRALVQLAHGMLAQGRIVIAVILVSAVAMVAAESLASGQIGARSESYARLAADTGPLSTGVNPSAAASGLAPADQDPVAIEPSLAAPGVVPARLSISAIGVDVDLVDLERDADGVLIPPGGLLEAGWYSGSVVPGDVGPSIIAGHVDDTETAGIFARLKELHAGDLIEATLSDGTQVSFVVDDIQDVAKAAFPTEAVYGARPPRSCG